jgi:methyltransferase (TIGR00027 family)
MPDQPSKLRNVSDTALWVAMYRARETDRRDAVFRDPYARRLAGERGEMIADRLAPPGKQDWPFIARTYLFDRLIRREIESGIDTVLNLAAGLDARPYRMELPASLLWVDVDLPAIIEYKNEVLRDDRPCCQLERVALDVSDREPRRALFERIAGSAGRVLVLTEGLLVYLTDDQVGELADDLAAQPAFRSWGTDLATPALLAMLQRQWGDSLGEAQAPLRFAPDDGIGFFERRGWNAVDVESVFKAARKLRRLPGVLRLFALLPEPKRPRPGAVWSGVCLLQRAEADRKAP